MNFSHYTTNQEFPKSGLLGSNLYSWQINKEFVKNKDFPRLFSLFSDYPFLKKMGPVVPI